MIKTSTKPATAADQTRRALVEAALGLFGERGFAATSTRQIANEAGANIGSIAYHFGGKDGLYLACAEYIVATIGSVAGGVMRGEAPAPRGEQAEEALSAALNRMVRFIVVSDEAGAIVQFVLRELQQPGAALDTIYDGLFEPVHRRLCMMWEQVSGEPAESEHTRLTVFTLIGQVVYFRLAREAVRRRMEWTTVGEAEAEAIGAVAEANLKAIIASRRAGR